MQLGNGCLNWVDAFNIYKQYGLVNIVTIIFIITIIQLNKFVL